MIINQGWGVSAWQAAKELSFPHLAQNWEDNREDWGSSVWRWLQEGRNQPELLGSHRDAELQATTSIYYRHNYAVWMLLRSIMGSEPS